MSGKSSASAINSKTHVFQNIEVLAGGAAGYILSAMQETLAVQDRFAMMLSGGSTPRAVYTLLASSPYKQAVDWSQVHIFWGDERCVPPDHPDSNYRMAGEVLISKVDLPAENVHRIRGEIPPDQAAASYEIAISSYFGSETAFPHFDLILLGMGEDGHIASLFPGSPAINETARWVVAVDHDQPPPPLVSRVTVTLPVINAARRVALIVAGEAKASTVAATLTTPEKSLVLPVQRVNPVEGELVWLLDEAAAGQITN